MNQLTRVRRHVSGADEVEVKVIVVNNQFVFTAFVYQIVGYTYAVLDGQLGVDVRLTYIQIDEQRLLACHAVERRQVR